MNHTPSLRCSGPAATAPAAHRSKLHAAPWGLRRRLGGHQSGVTLIEMLVAVLLGSAMVMAITIMLMRSESGRRKLVNTNDSSQNAAFSAYALDKSLRSAGSGFSQAWTRTVGCRLLVKRGGVQVLPRTVAFPAPFTAIPQTVRMAPLVVHAGAGSNGGDVLAVMTGAAGLAEAPMTAVVGSATGTNIKLASTVGLMGSDLVLVNEDATDCMVQQVTAGFVGSSVQTLPFFGTYAANDVSGVNLSAIGMTTVAQLTPLGNTLGKRPIFQLIGVGANATLVTFDMLKIDDLETVVPLADSVVDLRAIYAIDSNDDGVVDGWANPATAPWTAATLLNGTDESQRNLGRIKAVRVGLILRSSAPDRLDVTPASLTLFADQPAAVQVVRNYTAAERLVRHRSVEFMVPLRNVMVPRV
jgi:type IV pilus assembly protein PilW